MKKQLLLKQFGYSIPSTALVISVTKTSHIVSGHLPLMRVSFDFEHGKMKLEGDWQYLMATNKHNGANWFTCHRDRVSIAMDIFPISPINLHDKESDGLVFTLEGLINDGESIGGCSGLMVLDNVKGKKGRFSNRWDFTFYIYDLQFEFCEIKFRVPVYGNTLEEANN